jgi:hypothetical protein
MTTKPHLIVYCQFLPCPSSPAFNTTCTVFFLHPEPLQQASTRDTSSFWWFSPHNLAIANFFAGTLPPARPAHTTYVLVIPSLTLATPVIKSKPFLPMEGKPLITSPPFFGQGNATSNFDQSHSHQQLQPQPTHQRF